MKIISTLACIALLIVTVVYASAIHTPVELPSTTSALTSIVSSDPHGELYNGNTTNLDFYNTTNPFASIMGTPLDEVNITEGPRTVNVLLAGDEEAQNTQYWIDRVGIIDFYADWITYSEWQIERADEALVAKFGIDLRIRGAVTWCSNDTLPYPLLMNWDMGNQTGWDYSFIYAGYEIDVLFGVTGQRMDDGYGNEVLGEAFPQYLNSEGFEGKNTLLVKWQVYWKDDNLAQHEISHLFSMYAYPLNIHDHVSTSDPGYNADCIMSYRQQFITFIYEDGHVWLVFNNQMTAFLTYNYHNQCNNYILSWRYNDITLDGKVEIMDLALVSQAYGSFPGCSNWDSRADRNWDGKVDMYDLALVAKYFGLIIY